MQLLKTVEKGIAVGHIMLLTIEMRLDPKRL